MHSTRNRKLDHLKTIIKKNKRVYIQHGFVMNAIHSLRKAKEKNQVRILFHNMLIRYFKTIPSTDYGREGIINQIKLIMQFFPKLHYPSISLYREVIFLDQLISVAADIRFCVMHGLPSDA